MAAFFERTVHYIAHESHLVHRTDPSQPLCAKLVVSAPSVVRSVHARTDTPPSCCRRPRSPEGGDILVESNTLSTRGVFSYARKLE